MQPGLPETLSEGIQALVREGGSFCARVSGECMTPLMGPGDLVRIHRRRLYAPGDVVAVAASTGEWVCHRFLGYARFRGTWLVLTKADSAQRRDRLAPAAQLLGKVVEVNGHVLRTGLRERFRAAGNWAVNMTRLTWELMQGTRRSASIRGPERHGS